MKLKILSKAEKKYINSLSVKKYRDKELCFVVEGEKSVEEFLTSNFKVRGIYMTQECNLSCKIVDMVKISASEMQQISNLKTASSVLAVLEIPRNNEIEISTTDLILALDDIQDPGNLGTIIRLADWFGIKHLVCSPFTADAYGPKTVQATMGSLSRINIVYRDLPEFFTSLNKDITVYGTFLNGENIYTAELTPGGVILLGNEGKGISSKIDKFVSRKLYIPHSDKQFTESLNVAIAAAIVCSEFRRRVTVTE